VILKDIGIGHVGLQHVHALVPTHVAHLESRCTPASRTREETSTKRVSAIDRTVEPRAAGVRLRNIANRLRRKPLGTDLAALPHRAEKRPRCDIRRSQPRLNRLDGAAWAESNAADGTRVSW
jgi:hypothetical protein